MDGCAEAVFMRLMYRSVVVKKKRSRKAKLSIYRSIYAPTLRKNEDLDTSDQNEFPSESGWAIG